MSEKFDPRFCSQKLLENYQVFSDNFKRFWIYDERTNLWREDAETILEKTLRKKFQIHNRYEIQEILAHVRSVSKGRTLRCGVRYTRKKLPFALPRGGVKCASWDMSSFKTPSLGRQFLRRFEEGEPIEPHWRYIPFKNGYYDLKDGELHHFDPDMFFINKVMTRYNPEAKCPTIDRIFRQFVEPKRVIDLYEMAAYCFIRDYPNQKFIFIHGEGANGKSTYGRILMRLLGRRNIAAISLQSFQSNRFAAAELYNRYANINIEVDYKDLPRTDTIKKLTGGDPVMAERKYGHPFVFINYAKLLFLVNELPRTPDRMEAFYRRIHLVEFPNKFTGKKQDRLLLSKISREEYEGLAAKCIEVLCNMKDRGFAFTNETGAAQMAKEYERRTNPLKIFLREMCQKDFGSYVFKDDFREGFAKWMEENKYPRSKFPPRVGLET